MKTEHVGTVLCLVARQPYLAIYWNRMLLFLTSITKPGKSYKFSRVIALCMVELQLFEVRDLDVCGSLISSNALTCGHIYSETVE